MSPPSRLEVGIDVSAVPDRPAGAGRYIFELVRALAQRDDVALCCYARREDTARWREIAPSPHRILGATPDGRIGRIAYGELALGQRARRTRPPIAVFHGPHYSLPRSRPAPEVVTVHDLTLIEHPEWHERSKTAFFGAAMRRSAGRAERIIVLSERDRLRFVARFAPRGEVVVIPHGVDHARFRDSEPRTGADRQVLERRGVRAPYVLYLGTIEPRKNLPVLLEAFERLRLRHRDLRLVLAGTPGWGSGDFERRLALSSEREAVSLLGYVDDDDVPALLRAASAVAYPSSAEGFGLPVLEALACGSPIVTTTSSVMADVAGGAALLARAGDAFDLGEAIDEALAGGPTGAARRAAGLVRAGEFTWERCASTHLETYRMAAAASPTPRLT